MYGSLFSLTTQELVRIKETDVKQGLLLQLILGLRGALRKTSVDKISEVSVDNTTVASEEISEASKELTENVADRDQKVTEKIIEKVMEDVE